MDVSEADIKVPQIDRRGQPIGPNQTIEEYAQSLIADYEEELRKLMEKPIILWNPIMM